MLSVYMNLLCLKLSIVENLHPRLGSFKKRSMVALSKVLEVKEENQLLRPHRCAKYFKAPNHDGSRR